MAKRKNVLLILSDQQRMDTISAYGMNGICKTPHIDQLAAEGMKFTNAYTPSAICAPARASVMTGLYPHKHGVVDNFTNIREGTPLLEISFLSRRVTLSSNPLLVFLLLTQGGSTSLYKLVLWYF